MKWKKFTQASRFFRALSILVLASGGEEALRARPAIRIDESNLEGPRIEIQPSQGPPREIKAKMRSWFCELESELSQVRGSWTEVATAMRRGDRGWWVDRCKELRREVDLLTSEHSSSPPDPITRFYFARGVEWLQFATADCSETRLFALSFGLSQARQMFRQFDRRLSSLESRSCDLDCREDSTCTD